MTAKQAVAIFSFLMAAFVTGSGQATAPVHSSDSPGPRVLEEQIRTAVIRDYLQAWKSLSSAFEQNRSDLLDRDFVGMAKNKLAETIAEQTKLGIETRYLDRAHDVRLVLYSPEGLSIQLVDQVEYDVQLLDHNKVQTTQRVRARYVAVLTPAEVRWRVRVLQAEPE